MALHCETIEDVKARYKAGTPGRHFFDSDTLRFFAGRVAGVAYTGGGRSFFVTSEQFRDSRGGHGPRLYTVRFQDHADPGEIHTLGGHKEGFQAFASYGAADRAAQRAAREARELFSPLQVHIAIAGLILRLHEEGKAALKWNNPSPTPEEVRDYVTGLPGVAHAREVLAECSRLLKEESQRKAEERADRRRTRAIEAARRLQAARERHAARVAAAYQSGDVDSAVTLANREG